MNKYTQNIQNAEQVAGHTINNEYKGLYNPDPNHPNLIECPGCGEPVYKRADRHLCGYDFEKAQKEQDAAMMALGMVGLIVIGLVSLFVINLASRVMDITGLNQDLSMALVLIGIVASIYAVKRLIE